MEQVARLATPAVMPAVAECANAGTYARVKVTMGGKPATVLFAGLVAPGLYQINVPVPNGFVPGESPVEMFVDGQPTQGGVTLNFQ